MTLSYILMASQLPDDKIHKEFIRIAQSPFIFSCMRSIFLKTYTYTNKV